MIDIEQQLSNFPIIHLTSGEILLNEGEKTDTLYFLKDGELEVIKEDILIATVKDKGAVFGEIAIMLDIEHGATVKALNDCELYKIVHPKKYLVNHPDIIWHIAQILGVRLMKLNQYLVDVKHQYEGHDHLNMVDEVLETLQNQQKTNIVRRGESRKKNI